MCQYVSIDTTIQLTYNPAMAGGKTQQLQIRVTPEQKAALKRLAERAGQDVSSYVLGRVLPAAVPRFERIVGAIANPERRRYALAELNDLLAELSPQEFDNVAGDVEIGELSPYLQNYVAAMFELAADQKGRHPPAWVREVLPLAEPHFATPMSSLRLHLLQTSPVPFRRRNIFVDSSIGDRV